MYFSLWLRTISSRGVRSEPTNAFAPVSGCFSFSASPSSQAPPPSLASGPSQAQPPSPYQARRKLNRRTRIRLVASSTAAPASGPSQAQLPNPASGSSQAQLPSPYQAHRKPQPPSPYQAHRKLHRLSPYQPHRKPQPLRRAKAPTGVGSLVQNRSRSARVATTQLSPARPALSRAKACDGRAALGPPYEKKKLVLLGTDHDRRGPPLPT
jgi:hypothetical protein